MLRSCQHNSDYIRSVTDLSAYQRADLCSQRAVFPGDHHPDTSRDRRASASAGERATSYSLGRHHERRERNLTIRK